jgi:hypothetical protein
MRIHDFDFNVRELAGSMGDLGILLPLAIGYFAVNGLNPAGLLVMIGLANKQLLKRRNEPSFLKQKFENYPLILDLDCLRSYLSGSV